MKRKLYLLKVVLERVEPQISRRFVVPADIPLDRLHDVIQIVMGWQDYHLHEFEIRGERYGDEPDQPSEVKRDAMVRLKDVVKRKNTEFRYLYDFGDGWSHLLTVENTNYALDSNLPGLLCLDGARSCPPEDVGGVGGYSEFCEAMSDPKHEEHEEYKQWYEGLSWNEIPFDPERFDPQKVNLELDKYVHWSRPRPIPWEPPYL
jgi:hypothetical protein